PATALARPGGRKKQSPFFRWLIFGVGALALGGALVAGMRAGQESALRPLPGGATPPVPPPMLSGASGTQPPGTGTNHPARSGQPGATVDKKAESENLGTLPPDVVAYLRWLAQVEAMRYALEHAPGSLMIPGASNAPAAAGTGGPEGAAPSTAEVG